MPLTEMTTPGQGGGESLNVAIAGPTTQVGTVITLGFKPKYLMVAFKYSSTQTMACYYNADVDPDSYIRIYQATTDTQALPSNNTGIKSIDDLGFTMQSGNLSNFAYLAVG